MFGLFKSDKNLALIKAAKNGKLKKVLKLIENGADVNFKSKEGESPIVTATFAGKKDVVIALIKAGVDVNADQNGMNALNWAFFGRPELIKDLLEAGANINGSLVWATSKGYTGIMENIIKEGADINGKDSDGYTALLYAACEGQTKAFNSLIRHGADVNVGTENGETPLMTASHSGQTQIVKKLLNAGAEINKKNVNGHTALSLASKNKQKAIAELLIQKGAVGKYTPPEIKYGGFGEPYCSEECYADGGKYISAVMLKNQEGVCGFCQSKVVASMHGEQNCSVIPYENVNLFICNNCVDQGKEHLQNYNKCCNCEASI